MVVSHSPVVAELAAACAAHLVAGVQDVLLVVLPQGGQGRARRNAWQAMVGEAALAAARRDSERATAERIEQARLTTTLPVADAVAVHAQGVHGTGTAPAAPLTPTAPAAPLTPTAPAAPVTVPVAVAPRRRGARRRGGLSPTPPRALRRRSVAAPVLAVPRP